MLLLIYKNGSIKIEDDEGFPVLRKLDIKEKEIIVMHEDDLTKGQIISKQRQINLVHIFSFISEVNGYYIYAEQGS